MLVATQEVELLQEEMLDTQLEHLVLLARAELEQEEPKLLAELLLVRVAQPAEPEPLATEELEQPHQIAAEVGEVGVVCSEEPEEEEIIMLLW